MRVDAQVRDSTSSPREISARSLPKRCRLVREKKKKRLMLMSGYDSLSSDSKRHGQVVN